MAAKKIQKSQKAKKQTRAIAAKRAGKPFEPGNPYAFKPGQSGNPAGRPRNVQYLGEAYRAELSRPSADDPKRTNAEMIAERVVLAAARGDMAAAREIADRTEGRATQKLQVSRVDRERLTAMYERMVEVVMQRSKMELGEVVTRKTVIDQIAIYQPEIREYIS